MTEQEEFEFRDRLEKESSQQPQDKGFFGNAGQDIQGIIDTARITGQGIIDFPLDVYQTGKQMVGGETFSNTPIGQDVQTVGNAALQALPHGVNENGSYRIEPGSIFRQYQNLAAEPLKAIPGRIGEGVKQAFPENPLYQHPVNSALALAPLLGPAAKAARGIPGVDEGLNSASNSIRENYVAPNARRALGKFPMKMPVEEANQVGLDAMDQGIIKNPLTNPLQASRKAMLGRADALNESLGESIGSFLKGQGEGLDASKAMHELDQVKGQFMNDPQIVAKVERAKKLISINLISEKIPDATPFDALTAKRPTIEKPTTMGFQQANKLKGIFQKKVNYFSDAANQEAGKAIAGNFRNSIDTQLDELTNKLGNREGMQSFKADKKLFGSTRKMQDALEGQIHREGRNMPVSLPSIGVGIGGFIKGGGIKGLLAGAAAEWTNRYGSAAAGSIANDVANLLKSNPEVLGNTGLSSGAAVIPATEQNNPQSQQIIPFTPPVKSVIGKKAAQAPKILDDEKTAMQYLEKAKDNPKLARQMAEKDGWTIA